MLKVNPLQNVGFLPPVLEVNRGQSCDPFDLDVKVVSVNQKTQPRELITSKSLCTPTCGNTGTGNSFCCTCK